MSDLVNLPFSEEGLKALKRSLEIANKILIMFYDNDDRAMLHSWNCQMLDEIRDCLDDMSYARGSGKGVQTEDG